MLRLRTAAAVLALATAFAAPALAAAPQVRPARTVVLETSEGSDFSAAMSPRGDRLVMDLQGVLWNVPVKGGKATRLTEDTFEAMRPRWSPDGSQVAVQAYTGGMWRVWTLSPDGKRRRQVTDGPYDAMHPAWSPDGKKIAFVSDRGGADDLWILDIASGALTQATKDAMAQEPSWSPDGTRIAFVQAYGPLKVVTLATGAVETLPLPADPARRPTGPSWSPDGRQIAYVGFGAQTGRLMVTDLAGNARRVGDLDNAFSFAPTWLADGRLLYTANGKIRTIGLSGDAPAQIAFSARFDMKRAGYTRKAYDFNGTTPRPVKGISAPALSPDGRQVVFKALNDLWLLPIGGTARKLTSDAFYESDPVWSPDGRQIAYASDKAGTTRLFVMDLASGQARQVGSGDGAQLSPAWSPDGARLAYQTDAGETRILDLASGESRAVIPASDSPSRPSWSADGKTIVVAAVSQRRNRILAVDVASGRQAWHDPAQFRSISTRGDDGPLWSPDGRWMAFSMGGTLWILPVSADGAPSGPARQLTREASDAPSWAADSRTLLYLHNGQLRLTDIEGATPRTVPTGLTWTQDVARGRTLVHAGALWDGAHEAVRRDVDILVENNRIASIAPHSDAAHAGVAVVDASGLTVTPGLFEMHNHQQMRSKLLGDRQGRMWLAFGVTSTRSPGDPVYRAIEDRESLASGARIGPRLFTTGEMLEGSRLMWAFSRPVESKDQLAIELSRAKDLEYDLIKTYMRFPSDWQIEVADFGHKAMGVSTTSHFIFPGVAHGVDGAEHFGGPTRWGFVFPHLFRGDVYGDTLDGLARSGMELTTTNFSSKLSLLDLPNIAGDPRVRAFYPPWEMASLKTTIGCADKSGPCNFFLPPDEQGSRLTVRDLLRIKRAGGTVMIGTDAPLDHPALSLFVNMMSLQAYGFTPFETLQAATIVPARAQGVDADLGSIEPGKLADLVLVEGDPSKSIADLIRVRKVMKAGRLYGVEELLAPFAR
jgi:Tol biopolymer transport system component